MILRRIIVRLLNILGFSCLIGMSYASFLMFSDIYIYGRFIAVEPNVYVLTIEMMLSIYGIVFSLIQLFSYISKITKKKVDVYA